MSVARRFEVGKSYQFTGNPICIEKGESMLDKVGAVYEALIMNDTEIVHNWMDRRIRKCVYADPLNGTSAIFEGIFFDFRGQNVAWTVIRSYKCYLKAGMFQEVEVI